MEYTPLPWSKLGAHFTDEDKAREYMEFLRWGNAGPACPHCGGTDPYRLTPKPGSKTRKGVLKCRVCRKQFTVTVGTVFEDSHIKLTKWIQAIYLIGASKKGISAHQLHRMLGVTYRAAWFMAHRLRFAMTSEPLATKLSGTVEVDEGYIGGKRKGAEYRSALTAGRHKLLRLAKKMPPPNFARITKEGTVGFFEGDKAPKSATSRERTAMKYAARGMAEGA